MANPSKKMEVTFSAPAEMVEAAQAICEAFSMTIDEYMTNALRGELQCGFNNAFIEESEDLRQGVVHQVEAILGEEP